MLKNIINTQTSKIEARVTTLAGEALGGVQHIVGTAEHQFEQRVAPVRESVLKRFPALFFLAGTFGFTAVVTGMEQIMIKYDLLTSHPGIILALGIVTLMLTGTLYKKLG